MSSDFFCFLFWRNILLLNTKYLNTQVIAYAICHPSKYFFGFLPQQNTPLIIHKRQFWWGTDNNLYLNTEPNWHYPPYTAYCTANYTVHYTACCIAHITIHYTACCTAHITVRYTACCTAHFTVHCTPNCTAHFIAHRTSLFTVHFTLYCNNALLYCAPDFTLQWPQDCA